MTQGGWSRAAKIVGCVVFALGLAGPGLIAMGFLSIRSPLADGSHAAGPGGGAYAIVFGAILVGSAVLALIAAAITQAIVRAGRR